MEIRSPKDMLNKGKFIYNGSYLHPLSPESYQYWYCFISSDYFKTVCAFRKRSKWREAQARQTDFSRASAVSSSPRVDWVLSLLSNWKVSQLRYHKSTFLSCFPKLSSTLKTELGTRCGSRLFCGFYRKKVYFIKLGLAWRQVNFVLKICLTIRQPQNLKPQIALQ